MEREKYKKLKKILGPNFVGPFELSAICTKIGIQDPLSNEISIPHINFSEDEILRKAKTHILILFYPFITNISYLNIVKLRDFLGINPNINEPCFYNQDWYLKEKFANEVFYNPGWYLISKEINNETRGLIPTDTQIASSFPALILTYTFFVTYFYTNKILWQNDFIWTSDVDSNHDKIYVGRYIDSLKIAKNGFSIHRHLSITKNYGQL